VLEYLKAQTQSIHKAVEKDNIAKYILDHTITKKQYKQLLLQNYNIYRMVEEALVKSKHIINNDLKEFLNYSKSDALFKDLQSIDNITINDLKTNTLEFKDEAEIIGALYVIEGSMLGTLLLGKNIEKCKMLNTINAHNFFNQNDHKKIIERWKTFSRLINKKEYTENEKYIASESARRIFFFFKNTAIV